MILPQTQFAALILTLLSLLCAGLWANTLKLTGKWRFELYYFDFAIGAALTAILCAFTFGNLGFDGFPLIDDFIHAGKHQWMFGFLAGLMFNMGNILLVAGISVAGMSVAFPVTLGFALIFGILLRQLDKPIGSPIYLGLACVVTLGAILLCAAAYHSLATRRHREDVQAGKVKKNSRPPFLKGLIVCFVAGLLMGVSYPLFDRATLPEIGLGPYSLGLLFAVGIFASSVILNMFLMNLPIEGEPIEVTDYLKGTSKTHLLGLAGGAMWILSLMLAWAAANAPEAMRMEPASAFAVSQIGTLVAALCGLIFWKDFAKATAPAKAMAFVTLVLLAGGVALFSFAMLNVPKA